MKYLHRLTSSAPATRRYLLRAGAAFGTWALAGRGLAQPSAPGALPRPWSERAEDRRRGQNLAQRITQTMGTLATTLSAVITELAQSKKALAKDSEELALRSAAKERLMEEYRNGLFCSGCNQTKSQILAKGERFPHPGQHVVAPTKEQIARKENELQRPIDSLNTSVARLKTRVDADADKLAEGKEQLAAGARLWRTAHTYWRLAYERGHVEEETALRNRLADAERAAQQSSAAATQEAEKERQFWEALVQKQRMALDLFKDSASDELNTLHQARRSQQTQLLDLLDRDPLRLEVAVPIVSEPVARGEAPRLLGEPYRMGVIIVPPPGVRTPLPDVAKFVADFRTYAGSRPAVEPARGSSPAPAAPAGRRTIDPHLLDLP